MSKGTALLHAKTMLFVNHSHGKIAKGYISLDQGMGANGHVYLAFGQGGECCISIRLPHAASK
jgi:hypothetical protein